MFAPSELATAILSLSALQACAHLNELLLSVVQRESKFPAQRCQHGYLFQYLIQITRNVQ